MSKKKNKQPKPKRVTCPDCGLEYDQGAPHDAFCRGFKGDAECDECGEKHDDAFKCVECGTISCPNCGDEDNKLCGECKEE